MLRLLLATGLGLGLCAPALADCVDEIKDIMARSMTSGPFRIEGTVTSSAGNSVVLAEMVPPAAVHVLTTAGGQTHDLISIDDRTYSNVAGSWSETPEAGSSMTAMYFQNAERAFAGIIDARCFGEITVEGHRYLMFSYAFRGDGSQTKVRLYVDPATRLPARMESTARMGGVNSFAKSSYTYDPTIIITAPEL